MGKTSPKTSKALRAKLRTCPERRSRTHTPDLPAPTKRTSARGDRSGLHRPAPAVVMAARKNGAEHTKTPQGSKNALGQLVGVKLAPCAACGHVRVVDKVIQLCGVRSCVSRRQRNYEIRNERRKAQQWMSQPKESELA